MTMHSLSLGSHDNHDIGFRIIRHSGRQHWFRSNQQAGKALAHCMTVSSKDDLNKDETYPYCQYCKMIEELRDGMDGTNEKR